jgi:hypothetical protein
LSSAPGGEIQFRLVARSVTIEVLVAAIRLVGIYDLDACGAEGIEEIIEFLDEVISEGRISLTSS